MTAMGRQLPGRIAARGAFSKGSSGVGCGLKGCGIETPSSFGSSNAPLEEFRGIRVQRTQN